MHLMSTVTRSFLYLLSYMVIPFFFFHFNYSFHKHDISSDSFTSQWFNIFCRLCWLHMASFQPSYQTYFSWWQFLIITT
jgi:hypothetical protein